MKIIYLPIFCLLSVVGCGRAKEDQLQADIQTLQQQNSTLSRENQSLREEIQKLKETDQYYYQQAADAFQKGEYDVAVQKISEMKTRFPNSSLTEAANKLAKDSQAELDARYGKEQAELDRILRVAEKADIEDAVSSIESYLSRNHPDDLRQKAEEKLQKYKQDYEIVRTERESEKLTGIKLVSVLSQWDWRRDLGDRLLVPELHLKFKNISDSPIDRLVVKADLINVSTKEVFGEASAYVVGYGDTPLQPGYSKTAFLYSSVGYKNDMVALSFPNLVADIYINDKFYRKIKISKSYGGYDWNR